MKRRSPRKHRVKRYERYDGTVVKSHSRGKGTRTHLSRRAYSIGSKKTRTPSGARENHVVRSAFAKIKRKLSHVDGVRVVQQKDLKGRFISELQGWDVTGLKVHGYERKTQTIIVPDEPDVHEVIHEYGHYLYDITPSMKRVNIPASYPIVTEHGKAEQYNVFHGSNDEWFAYHFAFWVAGDTEDWHEVEKKKFAVMLSKVKRRR